MPNESQVKFQRGSEQDQKNSHWTAGNELSRRGTEKTYSMSNNSYVRQYQDVPDK